MSRVEMFKSRSVDSELFQNYEIFFQELSDMDSLLIHGGKNYEFSQFLNFGIKALDYALVGLAIDKISSLAKSFITRR